MRAPTDSRWCAVRTGAFVLVAAQIAVVGHIGGGGAPPDLPLLALMSALLVAALRPLAVRCHRFPVLLTAMVGTQLTFHLILTITTAGHTGDCPIDPLRMSVFHAAAALVSACLLATGDRILFALYGWLSRRLPRVCPAPAVLNVLTWTAVVNRAGASLRPRVAGSSVLRRGPPRRCAPSC